jgi:hypothetical protein
LVLLLLLLLLLNTIDLLDQKAVAFLVVVSGSALLDRRWL